MTRAAFLSLASLALAAALPAGRAEAASCYSPAERMTVERYRRYEALFSAKDERYAGFYTDDVVFVHKLGTTLRGRRAVVRFYDDLWKGFEERLEPTAIIIDNEHCRMAVEMKVYLTRRQGTSGATPSFGAKSPLGSLKPGDQLLDSSVVIYGLRAGKISSIRGGLASTVVTRSGGKRRE